MQFLASTETDKLHPFDGNTDIWIDIKRELTAGEERQITGAAFRRASRPVTEDGGETRMSFDLDYGLAGFMKVAIYLDDWNLTGLDGKPLDISTSGKKIDALKNLRPDVFAAIESAIDTAVAARHEEKKLQSGSPKSSGTKRR
jgi:hypothetical protein